MSCSDIINIILSVLSFILAAFSLIFVVITLRQNKKILESNENQISEMRREHQLSSQPIIILDEESFFINRPRFYYTPPEDKYNFQSTYTFYAKIKNISQAAAICVDATAELIVPKENGQFYMQTISRRLNIISGDNGFSEIKINISGDDDSKLFEALRERASKNLPQIHLNLVYKNATGGHFHSNKSFYLVPSDEDFDLIREWHTCIIGAPVESKEAVDMLSTSTQNEKWNKVFNLTKELFDTKLGDFSIQAIQIQCIEIPEQYSFCSITKDEYDSLVENHSYSHFLHKAPTCNINR